MCLCARKKITRYRVQLENAQIRRTVSWTAECLCKRRAEIMKYFKCNLDLSLFLLEFTGKCKFKWCLSLKIDSAVQVQLGTQVWLSIHDNQILWHRKAYLIPNALYNRKTSHTVVVPAARVSITSLRSWGTVGHLARSSTLNRVHFCSW